MKELFNNYINNKAPKQLKDLFDKLEESDAIMLQCCFEEFIKKNKIMNDALENINDIMWNSHMIKNHPVNHEDLEKIMIELEKWAEKTN